MIKNKALKRRIKRLVCILIVLQIGLISCYGDMFLDGNFNDWEDKPYKHDTVGDEKDWNDIKTLKWYPNSDDEKLYFFIERVASHRGTKKKNMNALVRIKCEGEWYEVEVFHNPETRRVRLSLYDSYGLLLWSKKGFWGGCFSEDVQMEGYVPLNYLMETTKGGFELKLIVENKDDRVPNGGKITISSIGTIGFTLGCLMILLIAYFIRRGYKHGASISC